jgi:hypothetical protein
LGFEIQLTFHNRVFIGELAEDDGQSITETGSIRGSGRKSLGASNR